MKAAQAASEIITIDVSRVRPFEGQPRGYFDKDKLYRLSESIKAIGQKQPVLLRPVEARGIDYEIIDGERRWRACKLAQIKTIRGIVTEVTSVEEQFELSVVSNFGREEHTALEAADALARIRKETGATIEVLAAKFAKSPAWVYTHLSFLQLDPEVRKMMDPELPEEKQLKSSIAQILAKIPSKELQRSAAMHIVESGLSAYDAKVYLNKIGQEKGIPLRKRENNPSHDVRGLKSFASRLRSESERILALKEKDFGSLLYLEREYDVASLCRCLEEAINNLTEVRLAIETVAVQKRQRIRDAKTSRPEREEQPVVAAKPPKASRQSEAPPAAPAGFQASITIIPSPNKPGAGVWQWSFPDSTTQIHGIVGFMPRDVTIVDYVRVLKKNFEITCDPGDVDCPFPAASKPQNGSSNSDLILCALADKKRGLTVSEILSWLTSKGHLGMNLALVDNIIHNNLLKKKMVRTAPPGADNADRWVLSQ